MIGANSMAQAMVAEVEKNPSIPVKRVYNQVVLDNPTAVDDDAIPEFFQVSSKLTRKKLSLTPPIPHNVDNNSCT